MKKFLAIFSVALYLTAPMAFAQSANETNGETSGENVPTGGAAGAGGASTVAYGTLAAFGTIALVGGAVALSNSGGDGENVDIGPSGTTGTVGN